MRKQWREGERKRERRRERVRVGEREGERGKREVDGREGKSER